MGRRRGNRTAGGLTFALSALLTLLVLGACGGADGAAGPIPAEESVSTALGDDPATTALPPGVRRTDVDFAHETATLHRQAVELAAMVANRDVSGPVRTLATRIGTARARQQRQLEDLLSAWKEPTHSPDFHGVPGELTLDELGDLYATRDGGFERAWLQAMRANLRGVVAAGQRHVAGGGDLRLRELARGHVVEQERLLEQVADLDS